MGTIAIEVENFAARPRRLQGVLRVTLAAWACGLGLGCSSSGAGAGGAGTGGSADSSGGSSVGTGGSSTGGSGTGGGLAQSGGAGGGSVDAGAIEDAAAGSGGRANGGSAGTSARDASSDQGGVAGAGAAAGRSGSGGGGPGGSSGGGDNGHAGVWRIMPVGDSITGTTCVPQLLSQQLKNAGRTNFIFVGSNTNNQSCGGAPNVVTEGHGGYLVTDLVTGGIHAAELPRWCSADTADVALMHFGTNDVWNNRSTQSILDAYSVVLADLRAVNPKVILFVAQIIPLNPVGCANCEANVQTLNTQIVTWASGKTTADSPVYVVDTHSAFTASAYTPASPYTVDGVHPNPAGAALISSKWYAALLAHNLP